MQLIYDILILKVRILLPFFALFNKKIRLFVEGRKNNFTKLNHLKNKNTIWFHAASLGEFEQAIPLIERLKIEKADHKILVTFFSPSGYEIRKNYALADVICYLPIDSKSNARRFIKLVNPRVAIFIKYEIWPNLLNELKKNQIKTILVSGIFRENQIFFKWYGKFIRKSLHTFHHFFVQNANSKELLEKFGFVNTSISGDTRFDRVQEIVKQDNNLDFINEFTEKQYTIVAGSTWKEDENLIIHYINNQLKTNEKVIIAPHNIKKDSIIALKNRISKKLVLFSEKDEKTLANYQILIIDTIGLLTKIYSVADVAYVGGGLKTGLHNILEPATYGIPVVIGNRYQKFQEAVDLVAQKGCFAIRNQREFSSIFVKLKENKQLRLQTGQINKSYVESRLGATQKIMNYLNKNI